MLTNELVNMIMNELNIVKRRSCLKIKYVVDVEMAPVMINNDRSLQFYMELSVRINMQLRMHYVLMFWICYILLELDTLLD